MFIASAVALGVVGHLARARVVLCYSLGFCVFESRRDGGACLSVGFWCCALARRPRRARSRYFSTLAACVGVFGELVTGWRRLCGRNVERARWGPHGPGGSEALQARWRWLVPCRCRKLWYISAVFLPAFFGVHRREFTSAFSVSLADFGGLCRPFGLSMTPALCRIAARPRGCARVRPTWGASLLPFNALLSNQVIRCVRLWSALVFCWCLSPGLVIADLLFLRLRGQFIPAKIRGPWFVSPSRSRPARAPRGTSWSLEQVGVYDEHAQVEVGFIRGFSFCQARPSPDVLNQLLLG